MKTRLKQVWNGRELRETVEFKGERYKIVTGLRNGGGANCVYHWSKTNGWNIFVTREDVDFNSDVSYVSDETPRKDFAEKLNDELKKAIINIFN